MIPAIPEMVVRTRDLALRLAAGSDVGGECLRFAARNAQRIPFAGALRREMFGQKYDLPNVMRVVRSEEHTSELQSRLHLVCRLLLEKKKKKHQPTHSQSIQNYE